MTTETKTPDEHPPCQATPNATLRKQVMDCRIPKSEREWWASREIESLELRIAEQAKRIAELEEAAVIDQREIEKAREQRDYAQNEASELEKQVENREAAVRAIEIAMDVEVELLSQQVSTLTSERDAALGNKWRPIETAPRDGTYVVLKYAGPFHDTESPGVAIGRYYQKQEQWWLTCIWAGSAPHVEPTHWMPLPAA